MWKHFSHRKHMLFTLEDSVLHRMIYTYESQ
jgi:hypothetical protein